MLVYEVSLHLIQRQLHLSSHRPQLLKDLPVSALWPVARRLLKREENRLLSQNCAARPGALQRGRGQPRFSYVTLEELDAKDKYHLNVVTIIRKKEKTNLIGKKSIVKETIGLPTPDTIILEDDILVVFGENKNILVYCDGADK